MLSQTKVLELGGIGPTQYCGQLLASLGARVTRLIRPADDTRHNNTVNPAIDGGKDIKELDLKSDEGRSWLANNLRSYDVVIEGFRPGVAERLGVDSNSLSNSEKGVVYCRIRGWNEGEKPAHDLNFLAANGILDLSGGIYEADSRTSRVNALNGFPGNLIGDFGGAGAHAAVGVLGALVDLPEPGTVTTVETSIETSSQYLMSMIAGELQGEKDPRGAFSKHFLSGNSPFYHVYSHGSEFVSVAAVEDRFWNEICEYLDLSMPAREADADSWKTLVSMVASRIESLDEHSFERFCDLPCVEKVSRFSLEYSSGGEVDEFPAFPLDFNSSKMFGDNQGE